jgi:hypothetical protein
VNACLAILAHAGAAKTVAEFMPQWKSLGKTVLGFVPDGHHLNGFDVLISEGRSAHAGFYVFDRFLRACERLVGSPFDTYVIAEYDTVNLKPELPSLAPGYITSPGSWSPPHNETCGANQLCLLSPWTMDRDTLREFIAAARESLKTNPDYPEGAGLLDRWIGYVVIQNNLKATSAINAIGYPYHNGIHERIRRMGFAWVHGWKSKSEFRDLWPQN